MAKLTVVVALLLAVILVVEVSGQSKDCPCNCRRNRDPVCAIINGGETKIYDNSCTLECANRCDSAGAVQTKNSDCGIPDN